MKNKQKKPNGSSLSTIVQSVDPLVLSTGGLSAGSGDLMPPAAHGPVSEADAKTSSKAEQMKKESSVDFPASEGLCPDIWDYDGIAYTIKPEIKQRALELVDLFLAKYKVEAKGVNVVGSICSNQYTDDGDVDIHVQVDLPAEVAEKLNNLRKKTQDSILDGIDIMVGDPSKTHPLEIYFQPNIYSDMGSCGCYDLMKDEWLSGPQLVDMEFDPYEEYEQSWNEAFEFGKRAQEALFELDKNLYRRSAILDHASRRDVYQDDQLMLVVARRLENIDQEIVENMATIAALKDEMVKVRRRANLNPENEQEAERMRTDKEWLTANSTFKFLQRLDVLDSVWFAAELHQSIANGDIDAEDAIQELMNGN